MNNKKCLYNIKELRNDKTLRKLIPSNYGVYQWWCKEKLLRDILKKLDISFNECICDVEKSNRVVLLKNDNNQQQEKDEYYCVYVGDTSCLKRRILGNHIGGTIRRSTLRKTIAAILVGKADEDKINDYLDKFCIEWHEYNKDNYHIEQNKRIDAYFRPLNNDDISSKSSKYTKERHYKLTKNGQSKKSYMLKQFRSKI